MQNSLMVSSIDFIEKELTITVTGKQYTNDGEANSNIIIKDMADSSVVYSSPVSYHADHEFISKIDLDNIPFINEQGKWSIYFQDKNGKTIRLAPTQDLIDSVTNSLKFSRENLVTEPYITVKENISLRTRKDSEKKSKKEMKCYITQIDHDNGVYTLTGETDQNNQSINNPILFVQKRNDYLSYEIPIQWVGEKSWKSIVDFNQKDFPNGTWDYYLKHNQKQSRIKLNDDVVQTDHETGLYKNNGQTKEITFYKTIKGSLSTKHTTALVHILEIKGSICNNGKIKLKGFMDSDSLYTGASLKDVKFVTIERNSEIRYETNAILYTNKLVSGKLILEAEVNYKTIASSTNAENTKWDSFLQINIHGINRLFRLKVETNTLVNDTRVQFDIPKVRHMYFYSTVNKYLSITLTGPVIKQDINSICFNNGKIILEGYAYFDSMNIKDTEIIKREIIIHKRDSEKELTIPITSIQSQNNPAFNAEINCADIFHMQDSIKEIYGFSISLTYKNYTKERKLRCNDYTYMVDVPLDQGFDKVGADFNLSYLLFTPGGSIKLESYRYSKEKVDYLKYGQLDDLQKFHDKDVWLIGERPDTAQDTGYHFFKYCRDNYPDMEVYYVLEENSPDMKNIQQLGNVLIHGSMEHFRIAAIAKKFIGSHDLHYLLPTRETDWTSYQKGNRIFLQHGVLGRKIVDYNKRLYKYPFHLFCVSSNEEFNLVTNTFGYDTNEVAITGLSRFDHLLACHKEERSIAVIPTWRDWIGSETDLVESSYYVNYKKLLTDEELLNTLKKAQIKLQFSLHYRMQHYVSYFKELESEFVEVIELGQIPIQDIIKKNKLLITDYSSVSFDFNYLNKPVVYYHFDFNQFFKKGILRSVEDTFSGDICTSHKEVLQSVGFYISNGFKENKQGQTIFASVDQNNNRRIFAAISKQP